MGCGVRSYNFASDWSIGRFTQTDPILENRSSKHYAYAGNNPVTRSDPMGLDDRPTTEAVWKLSREMFRERVRNYAGALIGTSSAIDLFSDVLTKPVAKGAVSVLTIGMAGAGASQFAYRMFNIVGQTAVAASFEGSEGAAREFTVQMMGFATTKVAENALMRTKLKEWVASRGARMLGLTAEEAIIEPKLIKPFLDEFVGKNQFHAVELNKTASAQVTYEKDTTTEHVYRLTMTWEENVLAGLTSTRYGLNMDLNDGERGYAAAWVCIGKKGTPKAGKVTRMGIAQFSKDSKELRDNFEEVPPESQ